MARSDRLVPELEFEFAVDQKTLRRSRLVIDGEGRYVEADGTFLPTAFAVVCLFLKWQQEQSDENVRELNANVGADSDAIKDPCLRKRSEIAKTLREKRYWSQERSDWAVAMFRKKSTTSGGEVARFSGKSKGAAAWRDLLMFRESRGLVRLSFEPEQIDPGNIHAFVPVAKGGEREELRGQALRDFLVLHEVLPPQPPSEEVEEDLEAAMRIVDLLAESANVPIAVLDGQNRLRTWSPRFARLLARRPRHGESMDRLFKTFLKLVPSKLQADFISRQHAIVARSAARGDLQIQDWEWLKKSKRGRPRRVQIFGWPVRVPGQSATTFTCIAYFED